jgi:DNA replication protein DnaD
MAEQIGWIKLHRQIKESWIFPNRRKFTEFEAWVYLLINSSFADSKILDNGRLIVIKRGELLTSEMKLGYEWLWDRGSVRRFLQILQKDGMILKKSSSKFTIITICNYASYQDTTTTEKQQTNNRRTTDEQQTNTLEEGKEDKEGKEGEEVAQLSVQQCLDITLKDLKYLEKNKTNQAELITFNNFLERQGIYLKTPIDYKRHFSNWKKKEPEELKSQKTFFYK